MGRIVYSMCVSLDGFVETPSRSLDWVRVDEELHLAFNAEAREANALRLPVRGAVGEPSGRLAARPAWVAGAATVR